MGLRSLAWEEEDGDAEDDDDMAMDTAMDGIEKSVVNERPHTYHNVGCGLLW